MGNAVHSPESASVHFRLMNFFIIDARQVRELMQIDSFPEVPYSLRDTAVGE